MKRILLSAFFTGRISLGFFMSSLFDAKCMWGLEKNTFKRHYPDFVWMLVLGFIGTVIGCVCVPYYIYFGISFKFMLLYYWTRRNPFLRVSLWMIPLKSTYLPFVLLFVDFLMSAEFDWIGFVMCRVPWSGIIGVVLGHIYYFCRDVIPLVYRHKGKPYPHITRAPRFVYMCFICFDRIENSSVVKRNGSTTMKNSMDHSLLRVRLTMDFIFLYLIICLLVIVLLIIPSNQWCRRMHMKLRSIRSE